MWNNKDIQLSKCLSWLLRHGAFREGLDLSPEGYVDVNKILQHKSVRGKYNYSDIERVVLNNDKQRFKLRSNALTGAREIKANQGHSIAQVSSAELIPIVEPKYSTVVHGTYLKCWPQIKAEGLSRMNRQHIHLAKGTLQDISVISGLRKNIQVYIYIDLQKSLNDGLQFYESENGVILTPGNANGFLEPKYFCEAVKVNTGFPQYSQAQDISRVFVKFGNVNVENINNKVATLLYTNAEEAKAAIQSSKKVNVYGEFLSVRPFTEQRAADLTYRPLNPKQDFTRSKQKSVTLDPKQIDFSGDFHKQLERILAGVRLTQEDVAALSTLYTDVEHALQAQWPGCTAIPFGSITTGLGVKTSDADCFIHIPPQFWHPNGNYVMKAKRILQQYPEVFTELFSIPRANTPIVKFFHIPTATNCDLTFKTPLGAQNSKLVAFMLHADPRLIPMAVAIKYWAKVHEFSGTGKLTNYALTLLIIFYLQQPPQALLQSVAWLQRDQSYDLLVDFWNTGFDTRKDSLPPTTNTSTISELIGGFFEYYSMFNFEEMVVCTYIGTPVKKEVFLDLNQLPSEFQRYKSNVTGNLVLPLRCNTAICVQDPLEQCHNVASAITGKLATEIKAFFKFAANAYENEKLNKCEHFFKTILLQKPKIIRTKNHSEYRVNLFPKIIMTIIDPDWKPVVRNIVFMIFETILKIKLGKVEEKLNIDAKKDREKYMGNVTKAIWKRKQWARLYSFMDLPFIEKQTKITEEILKADNEVFSVQFQVILTFCHVPRSAVLVLRMGAGDADAFRDFGKFFVSVTQAWFISLLKPYAHVPDQDTAAKIADTMNALEADDLDDPNDPNASADDSDDEPLPG